MEMEDNFECFKGMHESDYDLPEEITSKLLSPSLIIHMPMVRRNIAQVLKIVGENWFPHLKTTKIPQVWQCLLDAGIRNFKCSTTRELDIFCKLLLKNPHITDVSILVAYPHCGPN